MPATGDVRPNVFDPDCGSRRLLQLIADKWAALAVYALASGPLRHSQLRRLLGGVSQKMLTQKLRGLEERGLVERTVFPVVPPHVEYALTELGESLRPVLAALCTWSEQHALELAPPASARG
jgi:DNA-binding HxlR family transcriptional regulator